MLNQDFDPHKPGRNDIFHSHSYTSGDDNTSMGATSSETFTQRRALARQRKFVRQYSGMSHVHSTGYARSATSGVPERTPAIRPSVPQRPAPGFHEPPARYNPYS